MEWWIKVIRKDCVCNKILVISGGRCLSITDIEGERGTYLDSGRKRFFRKLFEYTHDFEHYGL